MCEKSSTVWHCVWESLQHPMKHVITSESHICTKILRYSGKMSFRTEYNDLTLVTSPHPTPNNTMIFSRCVDSLSRGIHTPQAFTLPTDDAIVFSPHPSAVLLLVLFPRQQRSSDLDWLKTPDQNHIFFLLRFSFEDLVWKTFVSFHNAGHSVF